MSLKLKKQPRVIFERSPLKIVVTQVRYPPIFALEQPAGVASIQEAIRDEYPVAEGRRQTVSLDPEGIGSPGAQLGPWRFVSEDGNWVFAVAPDFIGLETRAYRRFEEFEQRAARVLDLVTSALRVSRCLRLGLRYVNEIEHPKAVRVSDWKRFLREELLGIAGGDLLADRVTQALQQIQVDLDGGKLTIRHGYLRRSNGQSQYLLDLDAYDDSHKAFSPGEVLKSMRGYKEEIWTVFRNSITDELVDYLGPRNLEPQ
jgi:uncharacterized protein (TIGR04255 family)